MTQVATGARRRIIETYLYAQHPPIHPIPNDIYHQPKAPPRREGSHHRYSTFIIYAITMMLTGDGECRSSASVPAVPK